MNPVLIVTHLEDRDTGLVRDGLEGEGCAVLECDALDALPPRLPDQVSGIVSLGGRMSATDVDRHPFLAAEVAMMRRALDQEVPILGLCLGAQLLAVAAGGHVSAMDEMYLGWPELSPLATAREDPVFGGLPPGLPVLKWHEDAIELPTGAIELATTASPGTALFRVGPVAWGSQMHLEVTPPMLLDGWLAQPRGVSEMQSAGYEVDAFRAESRRRLEIQMAATRPVFSRFAKLVLTGERAALASG